MGHPVQHRFMSLALEVCIGAALSGVCGPTFLVSWRCLLRAPEHKWRGSCNPGERGREKVGEGREGTTKSQEIEIAVVGDDYSARARSNRPRAAPFPAACPLSSFQRTHSPLPTYPTVCLKSQNVRCRRRRSRFFLRMQCSALFKPISLFHSASEEGA